MNPHLGLPQLPPSLSTNPSRQLQLILAQVAKLSLCPSPLSQLSMSLPRTSPPSVPRTSPKALLPPSSIRIPSTALKLTHSLAQMRSSRCKLLHSKPRSLITTTTPSALTASSPTQVKLRPPYPSAWATCAPQNGFVSETMDRWSYSQGRSIIRYRMLQNSTPSLPTTSMDQWRPCPPGSSSLSTAQHHPSTPSAPPLPSLTTGETSPKSSDTDTSTTPSASLTQSLIKYMPNSSWLKSASRAATIVSRLPVSPTRSDTSRAAPTLASSLGASPSPATVRASTHSASDLTQESQTRGGGGVTALSPRKYSVVLLLL